MVDKPRHLLSGYAAEILTLDEQRALMEAALEDQDVFDQLVEEESWRRVLNAPGIRRELLEALEGRSPWRRFFDALGRPWVGQPSRSWALGAAAAALVAVVLLPSYWPGSGPADPGDRPDARGVTSPADPAPEAGDAGELELVPKGLTAKATGPGIRNLSYAFELWAGSEFRQVAQDYRFRADDRFRIRLETDFPAWVYLFNRTADEDVYRLVYPESDEEHAARQGEVVLPPVENDRAGTLGMDDTPEDERLVLVVATARWPAFRADRPTLEYTELEAELGRAEKELESVSWRRSVEEDRVLVKLADPSDELFFVARLLPE